MTRTVASHLVGGLLVALLAAPAASAKDHKDHKDKGKHHDNTADRHRPASTAGHRPHADTAGRRLHDTTADRRVRDRAVGRDYVIDRDGDRRIVTEYVDRQGLPPGLARRRSLPPGLARQLRERGQLPPGLRGRLVAVPRPLADRLPTTPSYYTRYFAGRDMIIVDRRTNRVAAIIPNVLPG
jgi:hypothetical protein